MAKRPVRQAAIPCFDDSGHGEPPRRVRRQPVEMRDRSQFEPIWMEPRIYPRRRVRGGGVHPRAVAGKPIARPGGRGGKIKFVIARLAVHREEYFAAGMAPEPIGAMRLARGRK